LIGRLNLSPSSLSPNLISFSMHSLGIMGFPRRIFDYPVVYFRFNWVQSFAWSGIALSMILFLSTVLIILTLINSFLIYSLFLLTLSLIFSIMLCGKIVSSTSENFECGFYSITSSLMRYRYNYWMIIIHFIISEQESMLSLLLIFGIHAFNTNNLLCLLLGILFIDTFFLSFHKINVIRWLFYSSTNSLFYCLRYPSFLYC